MSRRQQRRRIARRRRHVAAVGGGLAVVATLSTGGVAQAVQTFNVTNLNDAGPGSLRAAVAAVNADATDTSAPGDSIVFASGLTGTLHATTGDTTDSTFYLHRPVQIVGPGANKVTIDAASGHRGLYSNAPTTVSGLTFTGAHTAHVGPGIEVYGAHLAIDGVSVVGNGGSGGGAVDSSGPGSSVTITNSTISGNTASFGTGGVFSDYDLAINNSTVSGNSGGDSFGAGVDSYFGTVQITGSTIAGNVPANANGGQVELESGGTLTLRDSIVAGSTSVHDVALPAGSGAASFSLIRNPAAVSGGAAITTDSTDITGKDPLLGALTVANGGATPTMAPLPNSPVLDQGKSFGLTSDQRGLSRPFTLPTIASVPVGGDRADIGAVEEHTPAVSGVLPSGGGAGTHLLIGGTGFSGATKVMFGSTPATSFTVVGDDVISAVAPPTNGRADVRVITPLGESPVVASDRFSFPSVSKSSKPKLKGKTLNTGETVSCPTGGASCKFTFKLLDKKLKLGRGSFTLAAGASKPLKLKLKRGVLKKLKMHKKHKKLKLTVTSTDGTSNPTTFKATLNLKT